MVTAPDPISVHVSTMRLDGSRKHVLTKGALQLPVGSYSLRKRNFTSLPATWGSFDAVLSLKGSEGQGHHAPPYCM